MDLIVRSVIPTSAIDPNTIFVLRKLSSKKKTRELVIMSGRASPLGRPRQRHQQRECFPWNFLDTEAHRSR